MLLYSTREEAIHILNAARDYKITGENYVWVVTQSVMENLQTPFAFPVGMLGKYMQRDMGSSLDRCIFSPHYAYRANVHRLLIFLLCSPAQQPNVLVITSLFISYFVHFFSLFVYPM
jgi:hypothetical protein